jgi:ribonuclease HII
MPQTLRLVLPTLKAERHLWRQGLQVVAGVDEVGMGPLAGPVVAAAVVFPPDFSGLSDPADPADSDNPVETETEELPAVFPKGVRDSKTLTQKARERLDPEIRTIAHGIGIGLVEVEEIDRINIYQAGLKAMRLALEQLPVVPEHVLIDGRRLKDLPYPQTSFTKGDRDVYTIAAASIIAKVYRDHLMAELDSCYPEYGFVRHMGYGTAAHRAALRKFGPCPAHRRSFRLL